MKKINIFLIIGIILVLIGVLFIDRFERLLPQKEFSQPKEEIEKQAVLVIDDGRGQPGTFSISFREKTTAFDLLKNKTEELGLNLKTKTYDIGVFIEAIGDRENGQDGFYWMYYINGQMPQVAADKQELNPGDKVEFKFEKSPF